ncbi:TetR family transcriptional regulator [Leptobacterium flavescens]|uniref:TetR family transcriptional regulator n=1 Tax=Leptobacterium flavescens TaxID=472055 RepID=A0A6P0UNW2_9FLAO|nr:TetR/AcrR family transcriptional regulator [Leptobacterium flavescens]NER14855.1 TetR family transcriptional regulator [Leptobacterium flavescens]
MRPSKIDDIELVNVLSRVIRTRGYDGASLAELSEASGLKKASLYHRFPNGKTEMTEAVLKHIDNFFDRNLREIAYDENRKVAERLLSVLDNIKEFYENGGLPCIIPALSVGEGYRLFAEQIAQSIDLWTSSFTKLGTDLGFDKAEAGLKARNTLIKIQGALIVANGLQDKEVFKQSIEEIKESYLS